MIEHTLLFQRIRQALARSRVVGLLGMRQCGKTTLARQFVSPDSRNYFDLENNRDIERLTNARNALEPLTGTVVIDKVQAAATMDARISRRTGTGPPGDFTLRRHWVRDKSRQIPLRFATICDNMAVANSI